MKKISRRDFLKLMAFSSAGIAASVVQPYRNSLNMQSSGKPNILIFVLDALSARHMSLYGYQRETTPNLTRFASHANVYHAHYSTANFTSSGTASLLSGLHPWNHRAITLAGIVRRDLVGQNIFRLIGDEYYRLAFSQNTSAGLLLKQYQTDLDIHIPATSFSYKTMRPMLSLFFSSDPVTTYLTYDEFLSFNYKLFNPLPGSLFLGSLGLLEKQSTRRLEDPSEEYPFGIPNNVFNYFHNDKVYAGVSDLVQNSINPVRPLFCYFHLFSPHAPYRPRKEFVGIFPKINVPIKPPHKLSYTRFPQEVLDNNRKQYDEYIANVDTEFGQMIDTFEKAGILDNSYIILTSDHGETFERGEFGHGTAFLYDPVIHIPLLISSPGQKKRLDVFSPTSSVDVLPTLLSLAGKDIPDNMERRILPGLGGREDFTRSIFAFEAKRSFAFQPLNIVTIALIKEGKKLIYYTGYPEYQEAFELYDLVEDIEESRDLFKVDTVRAARMKEEIIDALEQANHSFTER